MLVLSSSAVIQLIMDGGARNQGIDTVAPYSGVLNYLPVFWKVAVVIVVGLHVMFVKRKVFQFDLAWTGLLILCFASSFWADYTKVTLEGFIIIFLAYLLINLHISVCGWQIVVRHIGMTFMCFLVLSVVFIFLIPSYGVAVGDHAGKWQGVFAHKNLLGNFAAMSFVFYLWSFSLKKSTQALLGLALSMLLAIGSACSTGLMSIAISTVVYVLLRSSIARIKIFSWRYILIFILVAICVLLLYNSLGDSQFAIGDKDSSFSDRNRVWAYVLMKFQDAPWFGHGLGQIAAAVTTNDADFKSSVGFVVSTAHNGFIEALHDLGIVGLALVVTIITRLMKVNSSGPEFELAFLFLLFFVVLNMFESKLLGFNIFFIIFIYVQQLVKAMALKTGTQIRHHNNFIKL